MHQTLSEELKYQHKFSFQISKCLSGLHPNQAEVNTFLGNTLNAAHTGLLTERGDAPARPGSL